ncbi:MAG TPA: DUF4288 domain-containing protein [Bacteroidetes bacterium]|jgi:hypothetical protein|nr:DUF4288 domain-containing protein [Bacteroidota bacterium]
MKWFTAKIVFGIHHSSQEAITQYDEQIRAIQARDEHEAFLKARMLGVREEYSFTNENNEEVGWRFVDVTDLVEMDELKDGMEIYSRIHETDSREQYIQFVHDKALQLSMRMGQHEVHKPAYALAV